MVLTYLDPVDAPGKTYFFGTMTMTWELTPIARRTGVVVSATGVPTGIEQAAHEEGMASSLANLSAHLERS